MSDGNDTTRVEYRTIERFVGYRFGSDGSVWTCWKRIGLGNDGGSRCEPTGSWKRMKYYINRGGYHCVTLKCHDRFKPRPYSIHSLVLEAFSDPRPPGLECRHLDGDRTNNVPDNLKWGTGAENQADRPGHGTSPRRFTKQEVIDIRNDVANGMTYRAIARRYGVVHETISRMIRYDLWKPVIVLGVIAIRFLLGMV